LGFFFTISKKWGAFGLLTSGVILAGIALYASGAFDNNGIHRYPNTQFFKSVGILSNE